MKKAIKMAICLMLLLLASGCKVPDKLMHCNNLVHVQQLSNPNTNTEALHTVYKDSIPDRRLAEGHHKKNALVHKSHILATLQMARAVLNDKRPELPEMLYPNLTSGLQHADSNKDNSWLIGLIILLLLLIAAVPDTLISTIALVLIGITIVLTLFMLFYTSKEDEDRKEAIAGLTKVLRVIGRVFLSISIFLLLLILISPGLSFSLGTFLLVVFFMGFILLVIGATFNPENQPTTNDTKEDGAEEKTREKNKTNGLNYRITGIIMIAAGISALILAQLLDIFFPLLEIILILSAASIIAGIVILIIGLILLIKTNNDEDHQSSRLYRAHYLLMLGLFFVFLGICCLVAPLLFPVIAASSFLTIFIQAVALVSFINAFIELIAAVVLSRI